MRKWINLCEAQQDKFWCRGRTGEIFWLQPGDHHAHAAFTIPACRAALSKLWGEDTFEAVEERVIEAYAVFRADGSMSDEPFLREHDRVLDALFGCGFIRGLRGHDSFNLNYNIPTDRYAKKLAATLGLDCSYIECNDADDGVYLGDQRFDLWLKGRPIQWFFDQR